MLADTKFVSHHEVESMRIRIEANIRVYAQNRSEARRKRRKRAYDAVRDPSPPHVSKEPTPPPAVAQDPSPPAVRVYDPCAVDRASPDSDASTVPYASPDVLAQPHPPQSEHDGCITHSDQIRLLLAMSADDPPAPPFDPNMTDTEPMFL